MLSRRLALGALVLEQLHEEGPRDVGAMLCVCVVVFDAAAKLGITLQSLTSRGTAS